MSGTPHGGALVDRIARGPDRAALVTRALMLPTIVLESHQISDLELVAIGAASPLRGFLGRADYESVLERLRLPDDTVWPLPITPSASDAECAVARRTGAVALLDRRGRLWSVLRVDAVYARDPRAEALALYGTCEVGHPGVLYPHSSPAYLLGGEVTVLLPPDYPRFADRRYTPRRLRAEFARRSWNRVAGFQTRNIIHRSCEHITKLALEWTDGLVVHPPVGETADEALLERCCPRDRTILATFPGGMRYSGQREALFHALVRKNSRITHLIAGHEHAGVGTYYEPFHARLVFDRFDPADLGITPLLFGAAFDCSVCEETTSSGACPHPLEAQPEISATAARDLLPAGAERSKQLTRPEVMGILRSHIAPRAPRPSRRNEATAQRRASGGSTRGSIVWFTGLSGAGKSTLAKAVAREMSAHTRIEILDGDEVRAHLSSDLGFSKDERDANVRRIGYVARLLARNGVLVLVAAISPYAAARAAVRKFAEQEQLQFVEVHVDAPLDILVARDVKGLYRRAFHGEITHFTGVSDPYEAPSRPEVRVRTDIETVDESTRKVLERLRSA
jgi:sulfate adenylyltransferase